MGSVDSQISDDLFTRGLFALREVTPVELKGLFDSLRVVLFRLLQFELGGFDS